MSIRSWSTALTLLGGLLALIPSELVAQKKSRDLITQEDLLALGQPELSLFDAVRRLRPHFLEPPRGVRTLAGTRTTRGTEGVGLVGGGTVRSGSSGIAPTAVYVDGSKHVGLEALRTIVVRDVEEVRYLDPNKSQDEYGISVNGGAVAVKLRKLGAP